MFALLNYLASIGWNSMTTKHMFAVISLGFQHISTELSFSELLVIYFLSYSPMSAVLEDVAKAAQNLPCWSLNQCNFFANSPIGEFCVMLP